MTTVTVNLTLSTGKTVSPFMWGFSGGGLCSGVDNNNAFAGIDDPDFQASAAKLHPRLIRFNTQQTQSLLENTFAAGVGSPDWTGLDHWLDNHAGFFNPATDRLIFGIGPAFDDTAHSPATYASWATAVAHHFIAKGQECFFWEIGNEPDGGAGMAPSTYVSYFVAIANALHAVNSSYVCGGPTTSFYRDDYALPLVSGAGARLGYIVYHTYGYGPDTEDGAPFGEEAWTQGENEADPTGARAALGDDVRGVSVGEYNLQLQDAEGGGNSHNALFDAAMYAAILQIYNFRRDPSYTMSAVWDLVHDGGFSIIGNDYAPDPGNLSQITPQGWLLGKAGQLMVAGDEVTVSAPSGLDVLASSDGVNFSVMIVNRNPSGDLTLDVVLNGGGTLLLSGLATRWELSPSFLNNEPGATTTTDLTNMPCPSPSIQIITGTLVDPPPPDPPPDPIPDIGRTTEGGIGDFWFDDSYVDFSDPTIRAKFITPDGSWVNLGENGELPTGTSPLNWLTVQPGNDADDFLVGYGQDGSQTSWDLLTVGDDPDTGAPYPIDLEFDDCQPDFTVILTFDDLQIQTDLGPDTDDQMTLKWSDDAGNSWSNGLLKSLGRVGQYNTTPSFYRLGLARSRVFEISWSGNHAEALTGVWLRFTAAQT